MNRPVLFLISFLFSFKAFSNQATLPEITSMSIFYTINDRNYWKIDGYRHTGGKDRTVTVKIVGWGYPNGEAALYTDAQCQNKIGSTPTRENKVYLPEITKVANMIFASYFVKVNLSTPGKHTFYSQIHLDDGSRSPCSTVKAQYTLSSSSASLPTLETPSDVTIVSSPSHGSPIVRVHGLQNGDRVYLYGGPQCRVPIYSHLYEGRANGTTADIRVDTLPLGNYTIYAKRLRFHHGPKWSDCSTAHAAYQVSLPTTISIPVNLRLFTPDRASSTLKTPTVEVSGVYVSDVIRIFSDSQCTQQVGSGTSQSGRIRITTQKLELGSHRLYANVTRDGVTTDCSTNYIDYTVVRPLNPSHLRLVRPNRTFSTRSRPPVEVSGVRAEDVVRLFSDRQCTNQVDSGTSTGESILFATTTFRPGNYRFYANLTRADETSLCSTAFIDYQVLAPVDDSMLAPIPAYNQAKFNGSGYSGFANQDGPVEWWISPDGTLWTTRFWSELENTVLAKIAELEKKGEDTSAREKELASIRRHIDDRFKLKSSRLVAKKFSDNISWELLNWEYNTLVFQTREPAPITTTQAILDAVEDRYSVRLNKMRENVIRPPTGLKLIRPETASSRLARPTVEVAGILPRGVAKIFIDDRCTKEVSNAIVIQEDMAYIMNLPRKLFKREGIQLVVTDKLAPGNYSFYLNTTRDNLISECSTVSLAYQVLPPIDDSMLAPMPAHDGAQFYKGYVTDRERPAEYWIRPDGTFWIFRFEDHWTERILAKIKYYKSIGKDTSSLEAEVRGRKASQTMKARISKSIMIAGKFSDNVSLNLLQQEYNAFSGQSVAIITTTATIDAVEDRYGVRLDRVRAKVNSIPISNQQQVQGQQQQPVIVTPDAPSGLKLIKPNHASSRRTRPTIEVASVQAGDVIRLFRDGKCTKEVGRGTASQAGAIRIRTKRLRPGIYRFYANITRDGVASACSTANVKYTVLARQRR